MKSILFVDTETSGMPDFKAPSGAAHQPRVVQLAAMLATEDGRTLAEFSTLIVPTGWTMDPGAQAIHGITHEDCTRYGLPAGAAMVVLEHMLSCAELAVAHNSGFDQKMLNIESERLGITDRLGGRREFFCTMRASTNICKIPSARGYKWPKLIEAYRFFFNKDFDGAHDAMADVRACAEIYFELNRRNIS